MTEKRSQGFTVIKNSELEKTKVHLLEQDDNISYQTNPMYQKLLNFRNLQEAQKKKFSVDDLFKLC